MLYTAKNCQLVLMALKPGEEIGAEVHTLDQFLHVEEGSRETVLDGVPTSIKAGFAVLVRSARRLRRSAEPIDASRKAASRSLHFLVVSRTVSFMLPTAF